MYSQSLLALCLVSMTAAAPVATTTSAPAPLTPSKLLNFNNSWAIQLPVGTAANPTAVNTISNPALITFTSPNFYVNAAKTGVVFYTPNTGITLSGGHPRTELRQMTGPTGQAYASWKSADSIPHQLNVTAKVRVFKFVCVHIFNTYGILENIQVDFVQPTRLVIFSQIISSSLGCEVSFRANQLGVGKGYAIAVCSRTSGCYTLEANYAAGTLFTLQLSSAKNVLSVSYKNLVSQVVWKKDIPLTVAPDFVYKAGSYCQVTTDTDPADAYCQVTINAISVV
ncbi:hypothetical protein BCR33DRAFT_857121 [Rhizoclosmatium globosum]|uniref:Alginate lyase 2 domain-containing protein n=1 Tax=Rhizoclosmatium globosum TaxID=329046 RepID=A0A1Y2B8Z7_9FUNG|nr:hypothetical protein BCR33DRAFT_857121 [Rhizoclosmatium globosum]|eukprot:ORY31166.1 hypothetical protein BCR33DRAFT_857121 [Rhizoclosmatium globosum]